MQQPIPQKWCSLATYKRIEENREREREREKGNRQKFTVFHRTRWPKRKALSLCIVTRHASFRMGRACNGSSITDLWTKLKRPVPGWGVEKRERGSWKGWYTPISRISRERSSRVRFVSNFRQRGGGAD